MTGEYIHGDDPDEQKRLSRLNSLLNERCLTRLRLRPRERVLDVGAGLGQLARAIARETGRRVVGVERSQAQIDEAERQAREANEESLLELRRGDAAALPLAADEWGTFDVAHARFLLEHVAEPLAVVQHMVSAVRRGGRVVLMDDDHAVLRLWPEPEGFADLWRTYMESYGARGNDPYIGRRLVALLHEGGAPAVRNDLVFFGDIAGSPDFSAYAENLVHILEQAGIGPLDALRGWTQRPDAAIWYGLCFAEGIRR